MSRDANVYLVDIAERCRRVLRYVSNLDEAAWAEDELTQDAVARNLEVIGEAVKRLPADMRKEHQGVPWQDIAGLRDILIHEYEGVDYAIIWDVAVNEVPSLLRAVEALLQRRAE